MADQPKSSLKVEDTLEGVTRVGFREASILDVLTIQKIGQELYSLIDERGKKRVLLDFGYVRFLSSQALGVLVTLRRKADKAGAKVALAAIRPELLKVFKITNLDKMFTFYPTVEEALEQMAS
jgi:anti-sigma B factor antagonist